MSEKHITPGGSAFLADGIERPVNNEQEAKELLIKSGRAYAVLINEIDSAYCFITWGCKDDGTLNDEFALGYSVDKKTGRIDSSSCPLPKNIAKEAFAKQNLLTYEQLRNHLFELEKAETEEINAVDELNRLSNELFKNLPDAKKDRIEKISENELSSLLNDMVTSAKFDNGSSNLLKLVKYIFASYIELPQFDRHQI